MLISSFIGLNKYLCIEINYHTLFLTKLGQLKIIYHWKFDFFVFYYDLY